MIMLDLSDLGLDPDSTDEHGDPITAPPVHDDNKLVAGSPLARALYEVWNGRKIVVLASPPGGGKSTLISRLCRQFAVRLPELNIVVACPTRQGAGDLAIKISEDMGDPRDIGTPAKVSLQDSINRGGGFVNVNTSRAIPVINVRTLASCEKSAPKCDVLIIDEAFQREYARVMSASLEAKQIVLVGDPGQIGPVVTVNTSIWEGQEKAPHLPAPIVLAREPEAVSIHMDATYRLGPDTTKVIAPLYDFEFESKRKQRHILNGDGEKLPEIRTRKIERVESVTVTSHLEEVAEIAASYVGTTLEVVADDGSVRSDMIEASDIAVVTPHRAQYEGINAILRSKGLGTISCGTADSLQGGQWHVVIAVDPLVGHNSVGPFQVNTGRLCVMLSRHMTHALWLHDGRWKEMLEGSDEPDAEVGLTIRKEIAKLSIGGAQL